MVIVIRIVFILTIGVLVESEESFPKLLHANMAKAPRTLGDAECLHNPSAAPARIFSYPASKLKGRLQGP